MCHLLTKHIYHRRADTISKLTSIKVWCLYIILKWKILRQRRQRVANWLYSISSVKQGDIDLRLTIYINVPMYSEVGVIRLRSGFDWFNSSLVSLEFESHEWFTLEQDTLPSFIGTGWFQERTLAYFYNQTSMNRGSNDKSTFMSNNLLSVK